MTRLSTLLFATLFALGSLQVAAAQGGPVADDANHTVTIDLAEMNAISVGGDVEIVLDAVTAGRDPTPQTAESGYRLTTNSTEARKVTASISGFEQDGITLKVELTSPGTGETAGQKTLTSEAKDLVNNIEQVAGSGNITYTASATAQADPGTYDQTVTYTVTAQ
jgi:hypothetical protein